MVRNGLTEKIHHNDLQVGDIILIRNGDKIPVDGIVITGNYLESDESAMTGESDHIKKESIDNCLVRMEEIKTEHK